MDMENKVGAFIRSKGNPQERVLYPMLKADGHLYSRNQVRLWKLHYGAIATVSDRQMTDIDAETAVQDHREDICFCMNLDGGRKRLMTLLSSKGFKLTEHQARLALLLVKYANLPSATLQQWEDFADILAQGLSQEVTICESGIIADHEIYALGVCQANVTSGAGSSLWSCAERAPRADWKRVWQQL